MYLHIYALLNNFKLKISCLLGHGTINNLRVRHKEHAIINTYNNFLHTIPFSQNVLLNYLSCFVKGL